MCHLSVKLSDTFDQNPPYTFDNIREKPIPRENALTSWLAKIKSQCPGEQRTCLPKKISAGVPLVIGVTRTSTPMSMQTPTPTSVKQYVDPGSRHNNLCDHLLIDHACYCTYMVLLAHAIQHS